MTDQQPAIRVMLMPKDTNAFGTIFGGVILSYIDIAGAVEARRHTRHRVVTVAMREVIFHEPVYVGDTVSFYTSLVKTGNTSITVKITVEAQRATDPSAVVRVTEAEAVFVAIDAHGKKTTIV
ncbi:acyl-CoA thioesterase [bacterium]|nr:acyl-CoA thioesterase [bacterium]